MKLVLSQLCNLSISKSWHNWLYDFDKNIYTNFIQLMRESKNCSDNKKAMLIIVNKIKEGQDAAMFYEYLHLNHPLAITGHKFDKEVNRVFEDYDPNIKTYPKRVIMSNNNKKALLNRVKSFARNKICCDYIIIDDKAYIEYLDNDELDIIDNIPNKNWLIAAYRKNNV